MTRRRALFFLLMAVAMLVVNQPLFSAPAHAGISLSLNLTPPNGSPANGELQTSDGKGGTISCQNIPEAAGGKLIGKIVPCMIASIQGATTNFTTEMVKRLRPLLYTFLTLVVVLLGVRMFYGEPDTHKHALVLVIKVAFIIGILDLIPTTIVPATYGIMKESQLVVMGALDTGSLNCKLSDYGDSQTLPVWAMMDCVMGKLFGYAAQGSGGNPGMLLSASALGVLTGFLFGGPWGVVVFFGLLGVLISIFMLVVRTVYAFINSYLVICLVLIISPLILPLMFLRATQNYAEPIWKNIIGSFILPIVITAYATLALTVYDQMIFAPNSMLNKIFDYAKISPAQLPGSQKCSLMLANDAINRLAANAKTPSELQQIKDNPEALLKEQMKNPYLQNDSNPTTAMSNDPCALVKPVSIDLGNVDSPEFKKGKPSYEAIFTQLVSLIILGYLIQMGNQQINTIVSQLAGASSSGAIARLWSAPESKFMNAATIGRNSAINAYRNRDTGKFEENKTGKDVADGSKFLGTTRTAMTDGIKGFFGAISSKDGE